MIQKAIVNACTLVGWYPEGAARLRASIISKDTTILHYAGYPISGYNESNPYTVKASAIEKAIDEGFTKILWMDCSVWCIKDIQPIWDIIDNQGYYFTSSGYNAAQTCSDKSLAYFGITRDEAEMMPDSNTAIFGVDLDHTQGSEFIYRWLKASKDGVFDGSRYHDNQSSDPRFMFHRQDQSAATLLIGLMGLNFTEAGLYQSANISQYKDSVVLLMCGM